MKTATEIEDAIACIVSRMHRDKMRDDQRLVLANLVSALAWVVDIQGDMPNPVDLLMAGARINAEISDKDSSKLTEELVASIQANQRRN